MSLRHSHQPTGQEGPAVASGQSPAAAGDRDRFRLAAQQPPGRSCCCPARPVVMVIMPATATRPRPVDLWLCGHHYRTSQAALAAAGATVHQLAGPPVMTASGQLTTAGPTPGQPAQGSW